MHNVDGADEQRQRHEPGRSGRGLLRQVAGLPRTLREAGGLLLIVGLIAAVLALWALSGLTEEVLSGETQQMDEAAIQWLSRYASDRLTGRALEITALGGGTAVITIGVISAALLAVLRQRHYAALIALSATGAFLLSPILKALFDRDRPQVIEWRTPYAGQASFPSGHAIMAMVLYVSLAYVVHRLGRRRWISAVAITLAVLLVTLIGLTRVYLGVHYPSDVLAGYAVGFSWAMLCAAAVEMRRRRREG